MKQILSANWKKIIGIIIVVSAGLLIYLPSLKLDFSLLDDGLTVLNAKLLLTGLKSLDAGILVNVFLEPFNGRVRPGYWLIQSLFAYLSLYNSHLFHLLRMILLAATLFVSYLFMNKIKIHYSTILFVLLLFLFNIQNFENYYRLGPVEPLIIFILVAIYYLIFFAEEKTKNIILFLGIFTIWGGLIKENFFLLGFSLIPVVILTKLQKNTYIIKKIIWVFIFSLFTGGLVFFIKSTYPSGGVYAANYILTPSSVLNNILGYLKLIQFSQTPLFELSLGYFIFRLLHLMRKSIKKTRVGDLIYFSLWSGFVLQILALSPWSFILNRYLAFVNINLIFIYAITLTDITDFIFSKFKKINNSSKSIILLILFVLLFTKIFIRNIFNIANYQLYAKTDSEISYQSIKDLADNIPQKSTVYVNYKKGDSNIEIFEETGWHLNEFYSRNDIKFVYLDDTNLCTLPPRFIFDRRSDRFISTDVFQDKNKFQMIKNGDSVYKPVNYGIVVRSFIDRYKYTGWNDNYDFDWTIYQQKGDTCIVKK